MKKTFLILLPLIAISFIIIQSCQKEYSCEGCNVIQTPIIVNQPPIAIAGADQVINFPTDSAFLDGTLSHDPDGKIEQWRWTKIAGPRSFNIQNLITPKTLVRTMEQGIYQFELKVTDDKGVSAKDTMELEVKDNFNNSIRVDSLKGYCCPCIMKISNLDTSLSPGMKFNVYIRYYWGTPIYGFFGSFFEIGTIPDTPINNIPISPGWYWYEYSNGVLIIHYPNTIICDWDTGYHDVVIKW